MRILKIPRFKDVPMMDHFLAEKGLHNYEMDRHTRLIYHPIYGTFFQYRFVMALSLLRKCLGSRAKRIVEVGYSTGLLFPLLSQLARQVIGVDTIDPCAAALVRGMLHQHSVRNTALLQGSVVQLPLVDSSVDGILCISIMEHLDPKEQNAAWNEMQRVLRPGGVIVVGFPIKNKFTRQLLRLAGVDDEEVHPSSHRDILAGPSRASNLATEKVRRFPWLLPMDWGMYGLLQVRKAG
jgi:ubiquinone/menaquinone biosynthesis C-methylase UbiE